MARTLRRGNRGTDVAQLQADLNRYLRPVPLLVVDGDFGGNTDTAVRAFQRREGLTADGIVGNNTYSALQNNANNTGGGGSQNSNSGNASVGSATGAGAMAGAAAGGVGSATGGASAGGASAGGASAGGASAGAGTATLPTIDTGEDLTPIRTEGLTSPIAELAVQIAMTQIHVREVPEGSNDGPQIKAYFRSANKTAPDPWCMAYVYWCFSEAAGRLGVAHPMQGVPDWAKVYVTGVYAWARDNGKTVATPSRGDIFCVPGGSGNRTHSHTGIVTDINGGTVGTVEGNTNTDGSSNGIGVFVRSRSTSRLDFIRLP